jgi:hypothetical protein
MTGSAMLQTGARRSFFVSRDGALAQSSRRLSPSNRREEKTGTLRRVALPASRDADSACLIATAKAADYFAQATCDALSEKSEGKRVRREKQTESYFETLKL